MTSLHFMVFPVVMYGCGSWTIKKAKHRRIDAFALWCWRRLLRVPWTARKSKQSILKEISSEYSIGRTDAEAEAPVFWPPDVKGRLVRKDPDAGKDRRQEEKGTTEIEMIRWHHRLDGHESEQAPGGGDGWGSLACAPGESGLVSRGSQGLRSPLESRRGSLGAP